MKEKRHYEFFVSKCCTTLFSNRVRCAAKTVATASQKGPLLPRAFSIGNTQDFLFLFHRREQTTETQDKFQWIVVRDYSQHLQYLDSIRSSAKGLSLSKVEMMIRHRAFSGRSNMSAVGPKPNCYHVALEAVDSIA